MEGHMSTKQKWWHRFMRVDAALLLVSLVAGVAGAALSHRYLDARGSAAERALQGRYQTQAVVVAAVDVPEGTALQASQLAARQVPLQFLPADAVPVARAGELIGSRAAIGMRRGTPVVRAALRDDHGATALSSLLTGSERALTISVDEVNSQAGNLLAGDRVDLYYSRSEGTASMLAPLLQHVLVLAAGSDLGGGGLGADNSSGGRRFGTITLALLPDDAARVVLAQHSGTLSVVLRSRQDQQKAPVVVHSSRDLLRSGGRQRVAGLAATVEVLTGGNGELTPARSWLAIGQSLATHNGDRT
jgi:pilus assembly protein CpaB